MGSVKNGLLWSGIERFSVQGTQFILSLVIARLVGPNDFGLIAMVAVFMAIAQVFADSGFANALIQKKDRAEIDYSTVFYFNFAIAFFLYCIIYLSAPYIAIFYNESVLTAVTRWIGLNLIATALCTIQRTRLRIISNFKLIAEISFCAVIISGVIGVWLAYIGYGVWSLVAQSLSFNFIQAFLFWIVAKWYPRTGFSFNSFRGLFSFGSKILVSGLLHTVYLNLYSLVIGKFYNATDVGYYNRAATISQYIPSNLVHIITNVIFPLQCEHQDDDRWLIENFPKHLRFTSYIVFPIMTYIAAASRPLVNIILSEKWETAATLISILCLGYMWMAIGALNNYLINAKGRSDLYLKAEIIKKALAIAILIVTLFLGIRALCVGLLIYNLLDIIVISSFTKKILGIGFFWQMKKIMNIILICAISCILTYGMIQFFKSDILALASGTIVYAIVFIVLSKTLHLPELSIVARVIHKKLR